MYTVKGNVEFKDGINGHNQDIQRISFINTTNLAWKPVITQLVTLKELNFDIHDAYTKCDLSHHQHLEVLTIQSQESGLDGIQDIRKNLDSPPCLKLLQFVKIKQEDLFGLTILYKEAAKLNALHTDLDMGKL